MAKRPKPPKPSGLTLVDALASLMAPTLGDYIRAAIEYVQKASTITDGQRKAAQIRLSNTLATILLAELRNEGLRLASAIAGERFVGGGLRTVKADLSETLELHGVTLAVEIKPVHLAVGRAIWNRFGDIRTFAVNIHLKFPFAVVGGVMTIPTRERGKSGQDAQWRSTRHLIIRAVDRFIRAGGRETEGDAAHLLEAIAVIVYDPESGVVDQEVPPPGSGLRWEEFVGRITAAYIARFEEGVDLPSALAEGAPTHELAAESGATYKSGHPPPQTRTPRR